MHRAEQAIALVPEVRTDEMDDSEAKMYNIISMPSYSVLEDKREFYLLHTIVEGQGDRGGEVNK